MKVLHIPVKSTADAVELLRDSLPQLDTYSSIGLVATAQHLHQLDELEEILSEAGKRVEVGGQVLGCDASAAPAGADCVVYVGSGRFHPAAVAAETGKPVFILNPLSQVFERLPEQEILNLEKKKKARISRAAGAQTFGVLVSTKTGQFNPEDAWKLKGQLESAGKTAFVFAGRELSPPNVLPFRVDAWVCTACPRLAGDDFDKPVILPSEARELFQL